MLVVTCLSCVSKNPHCWKISQKVLFHNSVRSESRILWLFLWYWRWPWHEKETFSTTVVGSTGEFLKGGFSSRKERRRRRPKSPGQFTECEMILLCPKASTEHKVDSLEDLFRGKELPRQQRDVFVSHSKLHCLPYYRHNYYYFFFLMDTFLFLY